MSALLDVIIPVFLIIGFGYCAVWARLFSINTIDGLMKFTQTKSYENTWGLLLCGRYNESYSVDRFPVLWMQGNQAFGG